MDFEERREEIIQRLKDALEEAVEGSQAFRRLMLEIREEGFDISLGLAIMLTLIPRDASRPDFLDPESWPDERPQTAAEILNASITPKDVAFLRSLRIDLNESE